MLGTNALSELPLGGLSAASEVALSRAAGAVVGSIAAGAGSLEVSQPGAAESSAETVVAVSLAALATGTVATTSVAYGRAHAELDSYQSGEAVAASCASAIVRLDFGTRIVRAKTYVLPLATAKSAVIPDQVCVLSPVLEDCRAHSHPLRLVTSVDTVVIEDATATVEVVDE
jgi:hypothetical protein